MNKLLLKTVIGCLLLTLGIRTCIASMTVQSLNGPVTQTEISSFESFMAGQSPPTTNTYDNTIADGTAGMECEALGMMYEVTNDPVLLNEMIVYADQFMALRNDLETSAQGGQRVMWDGDIDPVWLTKPAGSSGGYAGCENNDIVGHIAYCAKLILQTPSLWNTTVPDGNPNGYGVTYYERATNYIGMLEYSEASYFNKYFISPSNDEIVAPTNAAWAAFGQSVNAWNRQMMFLNGWQRLAECHELLNDNSPNVAFYNSIVQASINWFFDESASGLNSYSTNSHTVYDWDYAPLSGGNEDMSLHADYDMWGLNRAYLSGMYNLSEPQMYYFGNTLQYVISLGNNTFADYVTGGSANGTRNYIYPAWTLVSNFDPIDYDITSDANIAQGSQGSTAIFDAFILWVKNANYTGRFASNTNSGDCTVLAPWMQTVTAGNNTTCTVTVSSIAGFNSSVTLGTTGLPSGVSASFNPASISGGSGTSTLTLSASSSVAAGTYSLGSMAITASGGSLTRISPLTLNVLPEPDFTISASPSSQNITIGGNTSYTVTAAPVGGFNGSVALSVSGLPANASGNFSPASISGGSGSSTLNISTGTNTPNGNYTLTITGVSGILTNSTTVTLLLNDFIMSVSPSSQTVIAGNSTNYTVTVGNVNGFDGTVNLSAGGLPAGATASFNPASVTSIGSSTMTITTTNTTPSSTNMLTITGTSGNLIHSTTAAFAVNSQAGGGSSSLPAGWTDSDIGAVGMAGSAGYTNGVFTIQGSGADIYGTNDEFNFCRENATNNFTITAEVSSQNSANSWSKSGVMIRGTASASSAYIGVYITPGNGVDMQCRTVNGASAVDMARVSGVTAPYWLRLVRSGNTFTGYCSPDGVNWTEVSSTNISMSGSVRAGLAVCSHNNAALNTSTFSNVSIAASVSLSSAFNREGIVTDGTTFSSSGGLDTHGYAYSSNLLGTAPVINGVPFALGAANASNAISASGNSISLPSGNFSGLQMLATAVNGSQTSQTFTVYYTDGSNSTFTQSLSDWGSSQGYAGETPAAQMSYRDKYNGSTASGTWTLYGYSFSLNNGKTISSITLPNNSNVEVFSLTLIQ